MQSRAERVARTGALLAIACALGFVETAVLPPLPVPGVRLGIANVAVVAALALEGPAVALAVGVGRVLLVGLATGSLAGPASLLAFSGALTAWALMSLLRGMGDSLSVIGWSVGGAAAHVAAQLVAASAIVGSTAPLALAPIALGLSLATGLATGMLAAALSSRTAALLSRPLPVVAAAGEGVEDGSAAAGSG